MIKELKNREDRIDEEILDALERARGKAADCDGILILMQHKKGGLLYETIPSSRVETVIYIASSFLHNFLAEMRGKS